MNRRRLLVLLVILGLLAGLIGRVPVAVAVSSMPYGWRAQVSLYPGPSGGPGLTIWASGAGEGFDCPELIYYTETISYTGPDLFPHCNTSGPNHGVQYSYSWSKTYGESPPAGTYTVNFYIETNMGIAQGSLGVVFNGTNYVAAWDPVPVEYYPWSALPLTVEIAGPASVDTTDTNMWTATAAGGTTPYTYLWGVTGKTPFWSGMKTGATLTSVVPAGVWPLQVTVMDADGTTATAYLTVTASEIAGSYQAHLQRSGPLGQYMSINVTDAAGDPVTISSTANTQFGIYATSGGAFGWVAADYEAVQYITYTWRWTMSANFGGATSPPPADFWFSSSVHLAIPNLNLLVSHHFTGINEHVDPWFPPGPPGTDVPPVIPETPPTPTSTLPDWLTPLWDFLVKLFKALFQPDATEFGKQLAGSWVTIASPVPSITPQYTIPFPNPQHLLAPTGDSVNIDFSGIMSYSGYSTYKLIVQVLLDAILVFVVISIIT